MHMKTYNAKKVVVSVLALAMGAGIAGSISGSIAWYQYSTRTTAQLQGVSAGTTRNLQLRIKKNGLGAEEGWLQDLSVEDLNTYLGIDSTDDEKPDVLKLNPVTNQTTGNAKDAALTGFKGHPVYQYPTLPDAAQTIGEGEEKVWNYVTIPLQFRLVDNNGSGDKLVAKNVYLVDANFNDLRTGDANSNLKAIGNKDSRNQEGNMIFQDGKIIINVNLKLQKVDAAEPVGNAAGVITSLHDARKNERIRIRTGDDVTVGITPDVGDV